MIVSMMAIMLLVGSAGATSVPPTQVAMAPTGDIGKVKVIGPDLGVPQHMNLQGYLTDTAGNQVNGSKSMRFDIYRGGGSIWNETQTVNVEDGLFSVVMGSTTAIPFSVFEPGTACLLQVSIEGDTLPKVEITSVGFAYRSIKSDTAVYAQSSAGGPPSGPAGGDLAGTYPNPTIASGVIVNADISSSAAIAQSKIAASPRAIDADLLDGYHANALPAPAHNHLGQTWASSSVDTGLTFLISRNSANSSFGVFDSITGSGSGDVIGGFFGAVNSGSGSSYGLRCRAANPAGTDHYAAGISASVYEAGTNGSDAGSFTADGSGSCDIGGVSIRANAPQGSTVACEGLSVRSNHDGSGWSYGAWIEATRSTTTSGGSIGARVRGGSTTSSDVTGIDVRGTNMGSGAVYGGKFEASGTSGTGPRYGVYASLGSGGNPRYAGYFNGDVHVNGTLTKSGGSFLIDHPLDPLNKTLRHNFVESPENLCLYRGKVTLDVDGRAVVSMPSYFVALTKEAEATAVLTPVGRPFAAGYEWSSDFERLSVYGEPGRDVSYLVMADRDDPVMQALRRPVEEEKGANGFERGKLMQPEAYGYPESMGYGYEHRVEHEQQEPTSSAQDE